MKRTDQASGMSGVGAALDCYSVQTVVNLELILIFSFMINTRDLTFFINESKNDTANLASCCAWVVCLGWRANQGG